MSNRAKYIEAAQAFVEGKPYGNWSQSIDFCCEALCAVGLDSMPFKEVFVPSSMDINTYSAVYWDNKDDPKTRLARSLALLFMAEMEKL